MGVLGKCGRGNDDGGVVGGRRGSRHLRTETDASLIAPRSDARGVERPAAFSDLRTGRPSVGGVDLLQP